MGLGFVSLDFADFVAKSYLILALLILAIRADFVLDFVDFVILVVCIFWALVLGRFADFGRLGL